MIDQEVSLVQKPAWIATLTFSTLEAFTTALDSLMTYWMPSTAIQDAVIFLDNSGYCIGDSIKLLDGSSIRASLKLLDGSEDIFLDVTFKQLADTTVQLYLGSDTTPVDTTFASLEAALGVISNLRATLNQLSMRVGDGKTGFVLVDGDFHDPGEVLPSEISIQLRWEDGVVTNSPILVQGTHDLSNGQFSLNCEGESISFDILKSIFQIRMELLDKHVHVGGIRRLSSSLEFLTHDAGWKAGFFVNVQGQQHELVIGLESSPSCLSIDENIDYGTLAMWWEQLVLQHEDSIDVRKISAFQITSISDDYVTFQFGFDSTGTLPGATGYNPATYQGRMDISTTCIDVYVSDAWHSYGRLEIFTALNTQQVAGEDYMQPVNDAGHPWTITTGAHGPEFRLYYTLLGAGVTSPLSLEATVNLCNGIILINGEMDQNFIRHEYHSRFNE